MTTTQQDVEHATRILDRLGDVTADEIVAPAVDWLRQKTNPASFRAPQKNNFQLAIHVAIFSSALAPASRAENRLSATSAKMPMAAEVAKPTSARCSGHQ